MRVAVTLRPDVSQKVAFTDTSAQSTALNGHTQQVRLYATQDCYVRVGVNPVAVADGTDMFLPAGQVEYFRIDGGNKIAAVQDSANGVLFISEMTA